jgi:hypothetical protein
METFSKDPRDHMDMRVFREREVLETRYTALLFECYAVFKSRTSRSSGVLRRFQESRHVRL